MFTVHFSSRYHVWFACRSVDSLGEFGTIEAAATKATELNALI